MENIYLLNLHYENGMKEEEGWKVFWECNEVKQREKF